MAGAHRHEHPARRHRNHTVERIPHCLLEHVFGMVGDALDLLSCESQWMSKYQYLKFEIEDILIAFHLMVQGRLTAIHLALLVRVDLFVHRLGLLLY